MGRFAMNLPLLISSHISPYVPLFFPIVQISIHSFRWFLQEDWYLAISPDNLFLASLRAREMTEVREPKKSISMGQVTVKCNCSLPNLVGSKLCSCYFSFLNALFQIQPTGNNPASSIETKVAKKAQDMNGNSGKKSVLLSYYIFDWDLLY